MKLFVKQFSEAHLPNPPKAPKPGSSVVDFPFSDEESSLSTLWEAVRASTNPKDLENFMDAFIHFNHDTVNTDGHPTDVVHRIAQYFLEFIVVETELGSFSAEHYLFLYQKEKAMQTITNIGLHVAFLQEDSDRGASSMVYKDHLFLMVLHALAKLCSWNHNKDLVIKLFSAQLFGISCTILESLISHLEDMVMVLSDGVKSSSETRYLSAVFSAVLGFTQLVGRVGKADHAFLSQVRNISSLHPSSSLKLKRFDIDCLMFNEIPHLPNEEFVYTASRHTESGFKDKKTRKRLHDRSLDEFLDKVVPVLQKLLRKLSFLSNLLETDLHLADAVKSNLLLFCLTCQIEAISATIALLLFKPTLVGDFLANDSMRFARPFMTPKSPMFLNPAIAYEVYLLRALCIVRLCGMGQLSSDPAFNYARWIEECVETLQSLEPVVHFIMDNALLESSSLPSSDILAKGSELRISCSCPTRLNVKLPTSGVFPWDEDTSSAVQFVSFMSGDELESDVALTESIAQYWRVRSNSLPTNQSYLFDPSKSFLGTQIEKSRDIRPNANPMELIDRLVSSKSLQVLFDVVLLSQSSNSYTALCEATLEPILNCVNLYKASSIPGIILMQSLFRFLLRSMEQNPSATIGASRTIELWKKVLDVLLPSGRPEYDKSEISSKLNRFLTISEDETRSFVYIKDKKTMSLESESSVFASENEEDSEESIVFKLQLLTIDCALELLWLFSSQKLIFSMESADAPFQDHLEEQCLVDILKVGPSNFTVMLISRWLCNYAILHSRMAIRSGFWLDVVFRVNATLKVLVDQGQRALLQPDSDIFLWPSTYSCLRLLGKIFFDSISTNWLDAYLYPEGISPLEGIGISDLFTALADQRQRRKFAQSHIVFFRTSQFSDCRNFSVALIMRLMYTAAKEFITRSNYTQGPEYEYKHLCEALFDDIVKYVLNMIRNHPSEPFPDSHLASLRALFEGLKVLVKCPESFSLPSDYRLSMAEIQQLIIRYGPARAWHKSVYGWSKSRPLAIKDWLLCLESILLTSLKNPDACFQIILCSVPFVTALITNNEKLQEVFCSTSQSKKKLSSGDGGENHRHELCILIFSSLPGREEESTVFFAPLFEMLMGTIPPKMQKTILAIDKRIESGKTVNILDEDNKLSITHEFVLQILIPLLPCWPEEWQVFVLETTQRLLQGPWTSVSNLLKVTSMKPSLIELVLEVFHYLTGKAKMVAIRLLKHLGKFSVSVAELKKLIRCLKDKSEEATGSSADFLADILSTSMQASVDPQFYFYFEGKTAGIRLPTFQKWPGVAGFSFATWFAVDWANPEATEMVLFNLRQHDGVGFEIFLRKDRGVYSNVIEIAYAVHHGKGMDPVEEIIAKFTLNNVLEKWHYIGFAHSRGRKFLKKSHVQIVLDQEVNVVDVTFPRFANVATYACIGSTNPMKSLKASFHGQMSSVYLFSLPLPLKALQQLQMLTYRRFHEVPSITEGNRDLGLDTSISESLVLAYNPGVEINGILLNNVSDMVHSPFGLPVEVDTTLEGIGIKGHMNGILLEGTYVSTSSDIRNALDSLGGIKAILPMFERLEFSGNSKHQHGLLCQMFRLITNALNNTVETRRFMIQSGFSCLRFLLDQCDPSVLQASVVEELQLLQERFESDDHWNVAIFTTLYIDFSLWIKTPFSTQDRLLLEVEKFCRQRSALVSQKGLIKRLMQSIYITYSPDAPYRIRELGKSEQFQSFQRASIIGTLIDSEVYTLRVRLLNAVSSLLNAPGSITDDNIASIVSYIIFETNPHHKIEALMLLAKLVHQDKTKHIPALLNAFTTTKALATVSHLCGLPRTKLRLHTWMLLCGLMQLGLQTDALGGQSKSGLLAESSKKHSYHDLETAEIAGLGSAEMMGHTAQMYGLDSHALAALVMNAVKKTLDAMAQSFIDTELRNYEYSVMFHLLLMTMFGVSTKYIVQSLEKVPMSHQDSGHSSQPSSARTTPWTGESPPSMSVALREYKISIPMILPTLLEMLAFKHVPWEVRGRHFQELMDSIQSCENVDTVLGVPHWQSLFLNFYNAVRTERKYSSANDLSGQPSATSSTNTAAAAAAPAPVVSNDVANMIAQAMAKLHIYVIQFGEPKTLTYKVCPRGPANFRSYNDMTTLELFEIMRRDQRSLGCGVVKKSVGYLRSYVTKGLLPYDGFAFAVLKATLDALQSTVVALRKVNLEKIDKEMRFKILEMNFWFIVEITCQYLIMPPMHPIHLASVASSKSEHHTPVYASAKVKLSPPELRRATSDQISHPVDPYSLGIEDADSSFRAPELPRMRSASHGDVKPSFLASQSSSDKVRSLLLSVDEEGDMTTGFARPGQQTTSTTAATTAAAADDGDDYAPIVAVDDSLFEESASMAVFRPADLRIDESPLHSHASSGVHGRPHATESSGYDESFWLIIESLMALLGINDASFNGSWLSRDRMQRFEAAIKVGINRGRFVVNLVQDSVEAMLNSDGDSQVTDSKFDRESKNLKAGANQKNFLDRVIDNSLWLLLRAMLNLGLEGIHEVTTRAANGDDVALLEESISIKAIVQLSVLLNWTRTATKTNFDSETLFVLARFCSLLEDSRVMTDSLWAKFASKLLVEILLSHKQVLINKVETVLGLSVGANATPGAGTGAALSAVKAAASPTAAEAAAKATSPSSPGGHHPPSFSAGGGDGSEVSSPDGRNDGALRKRTNSAVSETSVMLMTEYVLDKVNQLFDKNKGIRLTWTQWMVVMDDSITEASAKEKAAVAARLDDMGFHKHTEEITNSLAAFLQYVTSERTRLEEKTNGLVHKICSLEIRLLKDFVRTDAMSFKKCEANWMSLRDDLCNERGPWGSGSWDDDEVAWTIDPTEEIFRMRKKLVRSGVQKSYLNQFLERNMKNGDDDTIDMLANTRDREASTTVDTLVQENGARDSQQETDKSDLSTLRFDLSILRDLHQYRAETDSQSGKDVELGGEEDDEDVDEDTMGDGSLSTSDATPSVSTLTMTDAASAAATEQPLLDGTVAGQEGDTLLSLPCEVITPSTNSMSFPSAGSLQISRTKVSFTKSSDMAMNIRSSMASVQSMRTRRDESLACDTLWACQQFPTTTWDMSEVCNVLLRYYQLRLVAVELFLTSRRVVFINLLEPKAALKFHNTLRALNPPNMAPFLGNRPITIMAKTMSANMQPLTEAWANREISNFEYLMRLNTIAGRTYNDLGQYPIFPWVLADYTSDVLDLKNPATFRDFLWPIGAQDPKQRDTLFSKYRDLVQNYDPDDEISLPPFHYGTHYSVAGFVVWYLMRCEPYTSLHIQLQDGRIDRADRLFDSIAAAWKGCTTNPSDAKELIPELYYNPDILVNINEVNFGTTQGHKKIDHIVLPKWAKDPHDFIFKHREALESEYVSRHLHHWIDLVFGYKQRPPHIPGGSEAAVDACNVFFHLTYENAVDLEKLKGSNPELYSQYVCQITEFGQTPCQLFTKAHIPRAPLHMVDIIWPIASVIRGVHTVYEKSDMKFGRPSKMLCYKSVKLSYGPLVMIVDADDKLLTVDHNRVLGIHSWQVSSQDAVPPFRLKVDTLLTDIAKGDSSTLLTGFGLGKTGNNRERRIGVPFAPDRSKVTKKARLRTKDDASLSRSAPESNKDSTVKFRPVKIKIYEKEDRLLSKLHRGVGGNGMGDGVSGLQGGDAGGVAAPSIKSILSPTPPQMSLPINVSRTEKASFMPGESAPSSNVSTPTSEYRQQSTKPRSQSMHSNSGSGKSRRHSHNISSSNSSAIGTPVSSSSSTAAAAAFQSPGGGSGGVGGGTGGQAPVTSTTMMSMNIFSSTYNTKVQDEHVSGRVLAYLHEASLIFSCGHWDWSVRVTSAENGKLLQILSQHHDVVTCLAVAKDYGSRWLVTGSRDCTIIVWEIILDRNQLASVHPIRTLYGHDETVTCVAIHPELDIIVSGSEDGTWITHNLRDGKYIRTVGNYEMLPKWWNKVTNGTAPGATTATSSTVSTTTASAVSSLFPAVGDKEHSGGSNAHAGGGGAGSSLIPQIPAQRAKSDQTVPFTGGLRPSPSEGNMTEVGSISTKEDSGGGDSFSSMQPSESSTNLSAFQVKMPIPTTPKRVLPMPLNLEQQLSPGDDGVSSIVHGGSSVFSFERPTTTTPSLHPDSLLSGAGPNASTKGGAGASGNNATTASSTAAIAATTLGRSQFWSVTWVGVSQEGYIVTYSAEHQRLATYTLSGTFVASKKVPEALYAFALSDDGMVLVTGGSACLITFRWVHSLELASDGPRQGLEAILDGSTSDYQIEAFPSPIRSIHLTRQERHLLVGLETGELRILAHDPDYLRERLHRKLRELGIL